MTMLFIEKRPLLPNVPGAWFLLESSEESLAAKECVAVCCGWTLIEDEFLFNCDLMATVASLRQGRRVVFTNVRYAVARGFILAFSISVKLSSCVGALIELLHEGNVLSLVRQCATLNFDG